RHTRFSRDWSSDVCSSDLGLLEAKRELSPPVLLHEILLPFTRLGSLLGPSSRLLLDFIEILAVLFPDTLLLVSHQIRNSVRERRSEERRVGEECRSARGGS